MAAAQAPLGEDVDVEEEGEEAKLWVRSTEMLARRPLLARLLFRVAAAVMAVSRRLALAFALFISTSMAALCDWWSCSSTRTLHLLSFFQRLVWNGGVSGRKEAGQVEGMVKRMTPLSLSSASWTRAPFSSTHGNLKSGISGWQVVAPKLPPD
jgi:hypothetical protein